MKLRHILAACVALVALGGSADAQVRANRVVLDLGALITLSAQGAATVNSIDQAVAQSNLNATVTCVFNQASHTGSPSSTISIQGKDLASGKYYTILTSSAATSDNTPAAIAVGRGVAHVANSSEGFPVPPTWRVSITIGGSTPVVTGTVGCARSQ